MDSYLYSKQLVKLRQGHMLVLHLPPGVLDGVNAALQGVRGRRRKVREGATPRQSRSDQHVQEDALHGHRLQYWWGLNRVNGSKDVTVSGKHHINTISDREAWRWSPDLQTAGCSSSASASWGQWKGERSLWSSWDMAVWLKRAPRPAGAPLRQAVWRKRNTSWLNLQFVVHSPLARSAAQQWGRFVMCRVRFLKDWHFCWNRLRKREAWRTMACFFSPFFPQTG